MPFGYLSEEVRMPRLPSAERRATILHVARSLFAEHSYAQTTMADIATAARMGVGSLYVYFPTKDAIALTLVDEYFAELYRTILPPLREHTGVAALTSAIAGGLECAARNLDVLSLCRLVASQNAQHVAAANSHLAQALEQAIAQQMTQGHLRQYDPALITRWINGQIEWAINECFLEKRGDLAEYERLLAEVVDDVLAPRAPGGEISAP
jgi:AcrR family transcriptional regulator